ncbi:MAG: SDR family NAD(P)-dependent oxidoreductase [Acidimicrobiales bacterium]
MHDLTGKTAIVTGAAQGIGAAYALGLASAGASVVAADIADSTVTVDQVNQSGGNAIAVQCDVSDERSTVDMAKAAMDTYGRIDVLVNNAAVYAGLKPKPFLDIDVDEWDRVMSVNARGTFLASKAVAPVMIDQGAGKIINIASSTVHRGARGLSHYVASKSAVVGLTRSLARELGPAGVTVNVLTPGFTMTDASKDLIQAGGQAAIDGIVALQAIPRSEEPDDLVGAILFLASSASDFMTGQTLNVDGGWATP